MSPHLDELPVAAEALAPSTLVDIACGIAEARELWEPLVVHDHHGRQPVRLLATEAYEVWVIGWAQGQGVDLHDHAGSAGVLAVVEGALVERRTGEDPQRLAAGTVHELPRTVVHEVANHEAAPATSIHVCSPPLVAMGYRDADGDRTVLVEGVAEQHAVLDAGGTARALHPAARG